MDKISAREAFELGKKRYFTGEPCKYGHISERMISNGCCLECLKKRRAEARAKNPSAAYERTKQWRIDNPGARAQEAARYRKKHPDVVFAAQKKYRETHKEEIKIRDAENKRRIRKLNPLAEKARLAKFYAKKEQERIVLAGRKRPELCEICNEMNIRIVFDHCHAKGHFRGWICDRCNKVLGLMKDSPDMLRKLAEYLEQDNERIDCERTG